MVNNILIINLMYIGDLLFTTPLLHVLRKHYPQAHIAMLADEKNALVLKHNPNLSELIAIDKKGYHNKLPNYLKLIGDIRKRQFDLVINLHANERASAIAAFSGAKQIVGFSAKGFRLWFDRLVKERTDIHQADAYLEVLKAIDITDLSNPGLELWVDEQTKLRADELFRQAFGNTDLPAKIIGLNTGGSWPTKRWRKEGFTKLADMLLQQGYGVAFFGGPMDTTDVEDIVVSMKEKDHSHLAVFTGKTSLLEMAALVSRCNVFISGDSGPMHIAVSQKVPVLTIFGPSNPVRYAPYQQKDAVIVSDRSCLACGKHQCPGHECMEDITAEKIIARIKRIKRGQA